MASNPPPRLPLELPIGLQEIALAIWLIASGFNLDALASEPEVGMSSRPSVMSA
jgi:hypothetical protein